ncbi:cytochrome c oxidase subunit 4 isoform 1, mitochondrial-like [Diorhabda sublineata]|uniref:cytochrome c oxidase subunit 4 isoform 1, mitochondrial-like n=1 Tax=Diorhabda sublineata TaxID=1163346 RepID=UPI0024E058D6|nr:cytochrome c oxidase subunit 4 isoform 1, mitochondrial-like [Diorhabda sublineata]
MPGTLRILNGILRRKIFKPKFQCASVSCQDRKMIGNREIVGFGYNGQPNYIDRVHFPMPAIRWREPTPEICALREKEKGDWHQLTLEEKKQLYRASFCQTFAEFEAPMQEWKSVIGVGLVLMACSFWIFYFIKTFIYSPFPKSFSEESRRAQFRRWLDMRNHPITGLASKWDYDRDDWKK